MLRVYSEVKLRYTEVVTTRLEVRTYIESYLVPERVDIDLYIPINIEPTGMQTMSTEMVNGHAREVQLILRQELTDFRMALLAEVKAALLDIQN